MLFKLSFIVFILFICQSASGQEVQGIVFDKTSRLVLEDVDVYNKTLKIKAKTNVKGEFMITAFLITS